MRPRPRLTRKGHGQAPHHAGDHDAGDGAARGVDGVWMAWGQGMDGGVAASVRSMAITMPAMALQGRGRHGQVGVGSRVYKVSGVRVEFSAKGTGRCWGAAAMACRG
jgi:hypothetical protein